MFRKIKLILLALGILPILGTSGCQFDTLIYNIKLNKCHTHYTYPKTFEFKKFKVELDDKKSIPNCSSENQICKTIKRYNVIEKTGIRPYFVRYSNNGCNLMIAIQNNNYNKKMTISNTRHAYDDLMLEFSKSFLSNSNDINNSILEVREFFLQETMQEWLNEWALGKKDNL